MQCVPSCLLPTRILHYHFAIACILLFSCVTDGLAQGPPSGAGPVEPGFSSSGAVLVTVYGDNKKLLERQAVVKLTNKETNKTIYQTTDRTSVAAISGLAVGTYEMEVSAVGYLTAAQGLKLLSDHATFQSSVTMKKDPAAVDLGTVNEKELPAAAHSDISHAINDLRSGKLRDAQKKLNQAEKLASSNAEIEFLFGYLFYEDKNVKQAEAHLETAAKLDARNEQALILLGRLHMQSGDYATATNVLERATAANPESWVAHDLLAKVYFKQQNFGQAREQALLAIEQGKNAAGGSLVTLANSLTNLGREQEAIERLKQFLNEHPATPSKAAINDLIAQIQQYGANPPPKSHKAAAAEDAMAAESALPFQAWGPPGIDENKPAVAAGVVCPVDQVIMQSGERVKEFVDDISQFNATEDLMHEDINEVGNPVHKFTLQFNYVASISETQPGFFKVAEYRAERTGGEDFPENIVTRGLPSAALIFHPDMRDNFDTTCEGLGQWNGKATWLIYFRQREDRPRRVRDYIVNGQPYPIALKGRAWIAADSFHIVRLETELLEPIPEIQLQMEHEIVEYSPVQFSKAKVELWLPKAADIYFDLNRHRYHREHRFDNFRLFAVSTEEKTKEPKVASDQSGREIQAPKIQ
jgi:tetratricopeptide (TPR) repeat protein